MGKGLYVNGVFEEEPESKVTISSGNSHILSPSKVEKPNGGFRTEADQQNYQNKTITSKPKNIFQRKLEY